MPHRMRFRIQFKVKNLESNLKDPKNYNFPKFRHWFKPSTKRSGLGEDD